MPASPTVNRKRNSPNPTSGAGVGPDERRGPEAEVSSAGLGVLFRAIRSVADESVLPGQCPDGKRQAGETVPKDLHGHNIVRTAPARRVVEGPVP